jgi:hypothetical protein
MLPEEAVGEELLRKVRESGRIGNELAMKRQRIRLQHEVEQFAAKPEQPFLHIVRQRFWSDFGWCDATA